MSKNLSWTKKGPGRKHNPYTAVKHRAHLLNQQQKIDKQLNLTQ